MALILFSALAGVHCSDDDATGPDEIISSRSYQGHASDADINNFVREYPFTIGTRLDDCQTCHTGGTVLDDEAEEVHANACDYCHYVIHPPTGWTNLPASFSETLNPYGAAYDDTGIEVTDQLWRAGFPADLIPSSEIREGALKVGDDGYVTYGPQRYHALILYHPEFERPEAAEFFQQAARGKTVLYRVGDWTTDFEGNALDGAAALPQRFSAMRPR